MDIKIILALVLGVYQALDTNDKISTKQKSALSIVLIIIGGLPTLFHLLIWVLGHGPKISPVKENCLKLVSFIFHDSLNNYLYLRNKGPYCSELKKNVYYITEPFLLLSKSDGEENSTLRSDFSGLGFKTNYRNSNTVIKVDNNSIATFRISNRDKRLIFSAACYGKDREVGLGELLHYGEPCKLRFVLGELQTEFVIKFEGEDSYLVTCLKRYKGSSQSYTIYHKLNKSQSVKLMFLMFFRDGKEILTNGVWLNYRRTNVFHSMNINEIIESVINDQEEGLTVVESQCQGYVEGIYTDYKIQSTAEKSIELGVYPKEFTNFIEEYMALQNYNLEQKKSIIQWMNRKWDNNCIRGNKFLFKNWEFKRLLSDINHAIVSFKLGYKVYHDKAVPPKLTTQALVLTNIELMLKGNCTVLADKLEVAKVNLNKIELPGPSTIQLVKEEQQKKSIDNQPVQSEVPIKKPRKGSKKWEAELPNLAESFSKSHCANKRLLHVYPMVEEMKNPVREELIAKFKKGSEAPASRYINNFNDKVISTMLIQLSRMFSVSEIYEMTKKMINYNPGIADLVYSSTQKPESVSTPLVKNKEQIYVEQLEKEFLDATNKIKEVNTKKASYRAVVAKTESKISELKETSDSRKSKVVEQTNDLNVIEEIRKKLIYRSYLWTERTERSNEQVFKTKKIIQPVKKLIDELNSFEKVKDMLHITRQIGKESRKENHMVYNPKQTVKENVNRIKRIQVHVNDKNERIQNITLSNYYSMLENDPEYELNRGEMDVYTEITSQEIAKSNIKIASLKGCLGVCYRVLLGSNKPISINKGKKSKIVKKYSKAIHKPAFKKFEQDNNKNKNKSRFSKMKVEELYKSYKWSKYLAEKRATEGAIDPVKIVIDVEREIQHLTQSIKDRFDLDLEKEGDKELSLKARKCLDNFKFKLKIELQKDGRTCLMKRKSAHIDNGSAEGMLKRKKVFNNELNTNKVNNF